MVAVMMSVGPVMAGCPTGAGLDQLMRLAEVLTVAGGSTGGGRGGGMVATVDRRLAVSGSLGTLAEAVTLAVTGGGVGVTTCSTMTCWGRSAVPWTNVAGSSCVTASGVGLPSA